MLDTVALKRNYKILPSETFLLEKGWKRGNNPRFQTWHKNSNDGSIKPRLTLSITPDSIVHLQAEVSLPKMIFGQNVRLPNEVEVKNCLEQISDYVESESGYKFDAQTALVRRVDYTRDYQLGHDKVIPRIHSLSQKNLLRRIRVLYGDSTLYFQNKGKTQQTRVYSKFHEVIANSPNQSELIELSRGILRLESSFLQIKAINALKDKLGFPERTANFLLTKKASDFVLSEAEELLGLDQSENSEDSYLVKLLEQFTASRTMRLLGFQIFLEHFGERFHKDISLGVKKDAYYLDYSDIRKAKVGLSLIKSP